MNDNQLKVGAWVRSKRLKGVYEIIAGPNNKHEYKLSVGSLSVWASEQDLSLVPKPQKKLAKPVKHASQSSGKPVEIDLHGMNVSQAEATVIDAIDKALLKNSPQIDIIHGLGSGTLKTVVHELLSKQPQIISFRLLDNNPGTTRAYL